MSMIRHLVVGWNKPVMAGMTSEFESRDTNYIPVRNDLVYSCPLSRITRPPPELQSPHVG
jgi:hypothetical protein